MARRRKIIRSDFHLSRHRSDECDQFQVDQSIASPRQICLDRFTWIIENSRSLDWSQCRRIRVRDSPYDRRIRDR